MEPERGRGEVSQKLVLVVLMAGLLAAALAFRDRGSVALADGGPHIATGSDATPDKCAGCHRIHTAETDTLLASGPTEMDFCYTCHGTGGAGSDLDAQSGQNRSNNSALRAGGFDFASINTTDPAPDSIGVLGAPQAVTSWHTADGTTAGTLWGNGALNSGAGPSFTLQCSSCHDPHGNGQYRILRPIPAGSGATVPANVTDQAGPKVYSTTNYFEPGPVSGIQMSSWCATCHTRYLASSSASSGDAIFANRHVSNGTSARSCTKCHAAHGTNAGASGAYSSTVGYPGGGTGTTSTAESRLLKMDNQGICIKCHTEY